MSARAYETRRRLSIPEHASRFARCFPTGSVFAGLSATWFFWQSGRLAAYLSPSLTFELADSDGGAATAITLSGEAVFQYFFTRSVAFGPGVEYVHTFGTDSYPTLNEYALFASFNLYL